MGHCEPGLFSGRPLRLARLRSERGSVDVVAHRFSCSVDKNEGVQVRAVALDVHRDFCEVAIADGGRARAVGRVTSAPEELAVFAQGPRIGW